jgi:uncharacterized protein DUF4157
MKTGKNHTMDAATKSNGPFFQRKGRNGFFKTGQPGGGFFGGIQAKLTVGQPNDVYEKEADSVADKVVQRLSEPGQGMVQTCAACDREKKIHRMPGGGLGTGKTDSAAGQAAPSRIESSLSASKGSGSPMTANTRMEMEDSFGVDLGHVRIHRDNSAVQMSKDLNAQAFTHGSDIYFNSSKYDERSKTGKHLLAHELTHVVQQGSGGPGVQKIRRQPGHDKDEPNSAGKMVDLGAVQDFNTAEWLAKANIPPETIPPGVMESEDFKMSLLAALNPLSGSVLLPLDSLPPGLEDIPENHMVEVTGEDALSIYLNTQDAQTDTSAGYPGGAGLGATSGISKALTISGFAAAGPNAIGIVAFPMSNLARVTVGGASWNPASPTLPGSQIVLGHTALYARVDGKIVVIRSYAPTSLAEAGMNIKGVSAGTRGVPSSILDHMKGDDPGGNMWDVNQAKSIEYPVSKEIVEDFIKDLPEAGPVKGGLYTARPEVGAARCNGQNCVLWATEYLEKKLGVPIGKGGVPQSNVGGIDTARQGDVMKLVSEKNPGKIKLPNGEEIQPRTGEIPGSLKVLKWGGRIFTAIDVGRGIWRIANADGLERVRVIGEEAGRFGGGYVGGEAGVGGCIAFGLATEGIGLIACGIVGGVLGSIGGEWLGGSIFGIPEQIEQGLENLKELIGEGSDAFHAVGNMIEGTFQFIFEQNIQAYQKLNYRNWDTRFMDETLKADVNILGQTMWRLLNDQKDVPPDADQQTKFFSVLHKAGLKMADLGIPADQLNKFLQDVFALDPNADRSYTVNEMQQMTSIEFVKWLEEGKLQYKQDPAYLANPDTFYNRETPQKNKERLDLYYRSPIESRAKLNINNWASFDFADILFTNYEKWLSQQPNDENAPGDEEKENTYDGYRYVADTTESKIRALGSLVWKALGGLNYADFNASVNNPLSAYNPDADTLQLLCNGMGTILKAFGENKGLDRFAVMDLTPEFIASQTPLYLIDTLAQYDLLHFRKSPKEIADLALVWMNVGFAPW